MSSRAQFVSFHLGHSGRSVRAPARERAVTWPSGEGVEFGHVRGAFKDVFRRVQDFSKRTEGRRTVFHKEGAETAVMVIGPGGLISFVANSAHAPRIVGIIADSSAEIDELDRRVARILGPRFSVEWTHPAALNPSVGPGG